MAFRSYLEKHGFHQVDEKVKARTSLTEKLKEKKLSGQTINRLISNGNVRVNKKGSVIIKLQ